MFGRLCVYCASSTGENPALVEAARNLGALMAERRIELVYGGGAVGLMGVVADAVMAGGGRVTGVIPRDLFPVEVGHTGITELLQVESMHVRKAEMIERSDGFIAMPGGFGTLEELAEVLTWAQIGIHRKPVGILNVDGFFDHLLAFFDRAVADRLLKPSNRSLPVVAATPAELLDQLAATRPPTEAKWINPTPSDRR